MKKNIKLLNIINSMNVILVYDVNHKRVNKIMKICRKYLIRVQNSVFEGSITESKLNKLKEEIRKNIDCKKDKVCIYIQESLKYIKKDEIGSINNQNNFI